MDEPGGHNAKGNNSVTKGQIRHDFTYMRCLKESNPEKLTVKCEMVAYGWEEGNGCCYSMSINFHLGKKNRC